MINVIVRVDTGSRIGLGHYWRCINLCSYFNNALVTIITKPHLGHIIDKMKYPVLELKCDIDKITENHLTWLGESQEEDANKTIECLNKKFNGCVDVLIVDHYAISEIWERKMYKKCRTLIVIDDEINDTHYADYILDICATQKKNMPLPTKQLLGPNYALLNSEILNIDIKKIIKVERVNIFLGGGDYTNETIKVLKICDRFPNIIFDVVVGSCNQHYNEIKEHCTNKENYIIHYNLSNIDFLNLINTADLCIGNTGMVSFERCILKKPSIGILAVDNQQKIYNILKQHNVSQNIGSYKTDYSYNLYLALKTCCDNQIVLNSMIDQCHKVINKDNLINIQKIIQNIELLAIHGNQPLRKTMLTYGKQSINSDDIQAVSNSLTSDYLTTGPKVLEFETIISNYTKYKYGVAVNSATAALHIACNAIGIKKGDEVIVTCLSFVASSNAILYCGGTPVFCDIENDTMNINPLLIESLITQKTKAIITVDFAGQLCDYNKINKIAKKYNLLIIQDASHAISEYVSSSNADITIFSFHPVKHLTTCEGGMAVTNNEQYYNNMKTFRSHGINKSSHDREQYADYFYEMNELGFNYRIPDLNCALGISQFNRLPGWIVKRQKIAKMYDDFFAEHLIEYMTPLTNKFYNIYHLYVIKLNLNRLKVDRDTIFKALKAENIGVNVHYIPIPMHPYYLINMNINESTYKIAKDVYNQIITLPLYPTMSDDDIWDVMLITKRILNYYSK
jgi:perosamine synthetase